MKDVWTTKQYELWLLDGKERLRLEAKLRELRERLREIEFVTFDDTLCVACMSTYPNPKHEPDCWLKREIDELDDATLDN